MVSYSEVVNYSVEELASYIGSELEKNEYVDCPEAVTTALSKNSISGLIFLKMTNDDLKELMPTMGDRILVKGIKESLCTENEVVSEIAIHSV